MIPPAVQPPSHANPARNTLDELIAAHYERLLHIADQFLERFKFGKEMSASGLVHETYLRLIEQRQTFWRNSGHLLGVAIPVMRRILLDEARRRGAVKRGADRELPLEEAADLAGAPDLADERIGLERAMQQLSLQAPLWRRVACMRWQIGMDTRETAAALGVSEIGVKRTCRQARRWLWREIRGTPAPDEV